VRDAILDYFKNRKPPKMGTLTEIRAHVQKLLGDDVPPSSIRSYLQLSKDFERTGRGTYRQIGR
jgi:hypothetical protein